MLRRFFPIVTMFLPFRQLALSSVANPPSERRSEQRIRIEPLEAKLSDLYRERVPVSVLNLSNCGLGVKVEDRFTTHLPVLIECAGLLIVGEVRHCMKVASGGFLLGLKINKLVDATAGRSPGLAMGAMVG